MLATTTWMDGLGRVIATQRSGVVGGTPGMVLSGRVVYDALGRPQTHGDPSFLTLGGGTFASPPMANPTTVTYDALSRVTQTSFPDGTTTSASYTIEPATDATSGTGAWLDTQTTDQLGRHHRTYRDATDRILRVEEENQLGAEDYTAAPTHLLDTNYTYDALDRLTQVADANGNKTTVEFDSPGRRTSITNPDTGENHYRFDPQGNLAERVTPNLAGRGVIANTWDRGRLLRTDYPDLSTPSGLVAQPPTVYTYGGPLAPYGGVGRVVQRDDASGRRTFAYDALGELSATTFQPLDADGATLLADVFETATAYDRLGRLESITYPDGEQLSYGYDAGGAVTSARSTVRNYVDAIDYDVFGHRTQVAYSNGVTSFYTYTAALHRLDTLRTVAPAPPGSPPGSSGPTLQQVQYTYADNGNVTDTADVPLSRTGEELGTILQHYEYDALDQLRYATGEYNTYPGVTADRTGLDGTILRPGGDQYYIATFTYDALGRMATNAHYDGTSGTFGSGSTSHALSYAYPATGVARVHAPLQITEATLGARTLKWDDNGNQVEGSGGDGPDRTTQWDDENRVLSITDGSAPATTFRYDANGQRTHKITDTTFTLYPDQWSSVRGTGVDEKSGTLNGPLETNHVYVGSERVASDVEDGANAQAYWYHGNHLASTGYVTDGDGAVTEHVEYYPFGATWAEEQGAVDSPGPWEDFRFTGKEIDSETGLYYFGARYYDADSALWSSTDPILARYVRGETNGGVFWPANLALYTYTWNRPVVLRDPSGLCPAGATCEVKDPTPASGVGFGPSDAGAIPSDAYDPGQTAAFAYGFAWGVATPRSPSSPLEVSERPSST